jgi:Fe-S cluster assembly protein SufD
MKLINLKNEELLIDKDTIEPLVISYDLKKESHNQIRIKLKKGVKASIIEIFAGGNSIGEYERDLVLEDGAKLEYLKYQTLEKKSVVDFNYKINLGNESKINMFNLEFGEGSTKSTYETPLDNENAIFNVNGLVKIYNDSDSKSIFRTIHNAPNALSDIAYKHLLNDKVKATFDAKSIVNEKALNSKVYQNSETLLLSEDAVIFAQPHLEINIDELEASHGATTGSLDEEQLFYLQARGISKEEAKQMLLKAVENKIYDKIEDIKIKEFIKNQKKA